MVQVDLRADELLRGDWFFVAVVASVALILIVAIVFAGFAMLLRLKNRRTAEWWGGLEAKWTPVILDVISGMEPPQTLLSRVGPGEELYFVEFLYRYAARLRGRERDTLSILARPYLARIVGRTRSGDPEQRARAIQTISVLDMQTYARTVVAALDDPAPLVAMIASRALARPEHAAHAGAVLARVHRYEAWSPRFLSSMLASFGPAIAPALRDMLADPGYTASVRAVVADALRRLNDLAAADVAARVLTTESHPDILAASLRILQRVGRPEQRVVIRRMCESPHFAVRAQAVGALRHLGTDEDVARLRAAFDDPSPWVALHAARGLRSTQGQEILAKIILSNHARADLARQILAE